MAATVLVLCEACFGAYWVVEDGCSVAAAGRREEDASCGLVAVVHRDVHASWEGRNVDLEVEHGNLVECDSLRMVIMAAANLAWASYEAIAQAASSSFTTEVAAMR